MATGVDPSVQSGENLDDLLKCNICLQTLKEPKLLQCFHTFCKSCIHTYVDSFKIKNDKIPCPICRQTVLTQIPDDVDDFVDKLPENNFIDSLLIKSSTDNLEKFCDSCKVNNKDIKGVSWCVVCGEGFCQQCEICHKSFKMTASHELIPITEIGNNCDGANSSRLIFCDDHQKSPVHVYCVDHKKACCTLCATLLHRKCEKVITIEEASSGIKQKSEVSDLLNQMNENIKLLADVINCREENETNIETETTKIERTVTKIIKEMKAHLDKIQNKILSELDATKKQTSLNIADDINDFTSYKSAISNWKSMLVGVVQHGSEQQCLKILDEISPKMEILQAEIRDSLKRIRNVSTLFEVAKDAKEFERTMPSIGDLKVNESKIKTETGKITWLKNDLQKIKIIRKIKVAPSGDTSGILLDGLMIFTANSAKKIVKYNMNGKFSGKLTIPSSPTDLCHMSESKIVVASWDPSELYIINYKNMSLLKTFRLSEGVLAWGICVLNSNHFLVGSGNQLTWLDQATGHHVKSETTSGHSYFVSTSGNNDYIYGDRPNSVSYVVNDTKKFIYTNKQLSCPRCIGKDDEGNFFLPGSDSNNIHQITDKGELIRIIPASEVGIEAPWTLRFEPCSKRFLVTCCVSGKATLCEME